MTDTGQVPGEGQPENAGAQPEGRPVVPAPGTYTFAGPGDGVGGAPVEDEDLLMPGAQGAWTEAPATTAPQHMPPQPPPVTPGQEPPFEPPYESYGPPQVPQQPGMPEATSAPVPAPASPPQYGQELPQAAQPYPQGGPAPEPVQADAAQAAPAQAPGQAGEAEQPQHLPQQGGEQPAHAGQQGADQARVQEQGRDQGPEQGQGAAPGAQPAPGQEPQTATVPPAAPEQGTAPAAAPHQGPAPAPGPDEYDGRDSGSIDYNAVHPPHPGAGTPAGNGSATDGAPADGAAASGTAASGSGANGAAGSGNGSNAGAGAPRRPLHLGPPVPEQSGAVRPLSDRGPSRPAPPAQQPGATVPQQQTAPQQPAVQQAQQAGPPTSGPEYLDVADQGPASLSGPQLGEAPQQPDPWAAQQQPGGAAETVAQDTRGTPVPEQAPESAADAEQQAPAPAAPLIPAQATGEQQPPQDGTGSAAAAGTGVLISEDGSAAEAAPSTDGGSGDASAPAAPGPGPDASAEDAAALPAEEETQETPPAPAAGPAPAEEPAPVAAEAGTEEGPAVAADEATPLPPAGADTAEAVPEGPAPAPAEPTQEAASAQPADPAQDAPEGAAPEEAVPEKDAPQQPAPEQTTATPEEAAAEEPAPEEAAPQEPAAEEAGPEQPAPEADAAGQQAAAQDAAADQDPAVDPLAEPSAEPPAEPVGEPAPGYAEAEREAVHRLMRERRDIRNGFRSDPIPHEVLLRVLEAAHTAPSVGHSQPWDFVVIRSEETRRTMHELAQRQREAYAKSLPKGRAKQFKELKVEAILDTPVNIVVTADPTRGGRHTLGRHTQPQMAPYSSALAVENLWLAARAEGLGVGWVSFFDEREMVRALELPEHLQVVAYLCVGYVDEFPPEPELAQAGWSKRRPLSWVVHEESYGRRVLPGAEPHDLLAETVAAIRPLDAKALGEAWERQKRMTKPSGALGMLEIISAQLCGLSRKCPPPIPEPAAVAVFAGDHGVHAQGVTPWPQEVTGQMVANFLGGGAVCNAFANQVGAEVCVIDVGVASELPATPGLLPRKVRSGTADMTAGPALTREEVLRAVEVGIETARDLVTAGNKALLTGEMGIANTTASAALIAACTGADPAEVTGRGTGINDETHTRKVEAVRRALELHQPDPADPLGLLAAVGGLEHAALVGLILGGASLRTPVILDGVSAGAAALVARALAPEALAACIAGHRSAEPGHVAALTKLGLRPLVDLDLRLGEGTGALLALPMVQSAARAMHEVATFDSAGVTEKD